MTVKIEHKNMTIELDFMELFPENEEQVFQRMGPVLAGMIKRRATQGISAYAGRLPKPKDSGTDKNPYGRPYNRTGQLAKSIGFTVKSLARNEYKNIEIGGRSYRIKLRQARYFVSVYPQGPRIDTEENVARREQKRAARQRRIFTGLLAEAGLHESKLSRKEFRRFNRASRTRTGDTNIAIAAILSQPPKDVRGLAGKRQRYRVLQMTRAERAFVNNYIRQNLRTTIRKIET